MKTLVRISLLLVCLFGVQEVQAQPRKVVRYLGEYFGIIPKVKPVRYVDDAVKLLPQSDDLVRRMELNEFFTKSIRQLDDVPIHPTYPPGPSSISGRLRPSKIDPELLNGRIRPPIGNGSFYRADTKVLLRNTRLEHEQLTVGLDAARSAIIRKEVPDIDQFIATFRQNAVQRRQLSPLQHPILNNPPSAYRFDPGANNSVQRVLTKKNYDPKYTLDVNYLNLEGGGSAVAIKTPENRLLLFDTGKTKKDAERIVDLIRNSDQNLESATVFISHPDADHINGLKRWLKDDIHVDEIIISDVHISKRGTKQLEKFKDRIDDAGVYTEHSLGVQKTLSYSKNKSHVRVVEHTTSAPDFSISGMHLSSGEQVTVYKNMKSAQVNDLSLMMKISHNDVSHFNLGDAGRATIGKLLKEVKAQRAPYEQKLAKLKTSLLELETEINRIDVQLTAESLHPRWPEDARVQLDLFAKREAKETLGEAHEQVVSASNDLLEHLERATEQTQRTIGYSRQTQLKRNEYIEALIEFNQQKNAISYAPNDLAERYTKAYNTEMNKLNELLDMKQEIQDQIQEVYEQLKPYQLNSDILQWPHHHWLPDLTRGNNKQLLDDLLHEVDARYIILSDPPKGVKQSLENLLDYLKSYKKEFGKDFEIIQLDSHFKVISLLDLIQQNTPIIHRV